MSVSQLHLVTFQMLPGVYCTLNHHLHTSPHTHTHTLTHTRVLVLSSVLRSSSGSLRITKSQSVKDEMQKS